MGSGHLALGLPSCHVALGRPFPSNQDRAPSGAWECLGEPGSVNPTRAPRGDEAGLG